MDKRGIRVDTVHQQFREYGCWLPARVGVLRKEVQSAGVWNIELGVTRWKDGAHNNSRRKRVVRFSRMVGSLGEMVKGSVRK